MNNSAPITPDTLAIRVTTLEREMGEMRSEVQDLAARLEKTEKGQGIIETELGSIKTLCDEIKADVKELKERPVRKYDAIATAVVQWLILAVLGAIVVFK